MKAIAYQHSLSIEHASALQDVVLPHPIVSGRDLLVEVKAISVNPVDTKVRRGTSPEAGQWKVLGWDGTGIVKSIGPDVTLFKPGDEVWYAGALNRPGSNSQLQLVDERIVGTKPKTLGFADAAALPLTSLTAWEMLFDRLQIKTGEVDEVKKSLLIIGAGGGVGSIMTQLASQLTKLTVIGTASRPETQQWVKQLGAQHVIDHSKGLVQELIRIGIPNPNYIVSLTHTTQHFSEIAEAIAPQGKFGLIDDPDIFDVRLFKRKSVSLHWELMFTRALFGTDDMIEQHHILNKIATLVDDGVIKTTVGERFGKINAENLMRAHALLESNKAKGKIVLQGFEG